MTEVTSIERMSAADRRAVRRAKILQNGEDRMKLVTGEISSNKDMLDSSERSKKEADVDAKENIENDPNEVEHNLVRVDPVERRREAIARRRKKEEKLLDQMIFTEKSEETSLFTERKRTCVSAIMGSCRPQVRLLLTQEFIARTILVGFAITTGFVFVFVFTSVCDDTNVCFQSAHF